MIDKKMIEDMLLHSPLSLLAIKDKQVIDYLNNLIPYSSAFEIECDMMGVEDKIYGSNSSIIEEHNNVFRNIPDIMDVNNSTYEQRYRIPNGLKGIICLYNISSQLKIHSLLNPLSSIHYHTDCTDCYNRLPTIVNRDQEWVLEQLDTWLVDGDKEVQATGRNYGSWFKLNDLQTIEYRLGEMTFDYKIILKRIIHCNTITKKFKDKLQVAPPIFEKPDVRKILDYAKINKTLPNNNLWQSKLDKLNNELAQIEKKNKQVITEEDITSMVRKRLHKIKKPSK